MLLPLHLVLALPAHILTLCSRSQGIRPLPLLQSALQSSLQYPSEDIEDSSTAF